MFSIRSKLISLLQPWLHSEPDLELKLGLLRSHGTAKNLRFDVSALNRLIDDSVCFTFQEARVQTLSIRFSPWSFPAFTFEVSGLYVNLKGRKPVDSECQGKTDDWLEKEKKTVLSVIDPEGTVLHDVIERISYTTSSRNCRVTSLLNVILGHCRLLIHDIHFELQLCITNDTIASFLKIKDLSLEALHFKRTCLLRSLCGAITMPQRVCSLALNASMSEIGLKKENHVNRFLSLDELLTRIKLKDLHLLDLDVYTPQLNIAFAPIDLLILQAIDMLSSKKVNRARNGKELWNLAASRVKSLTSNRKLSFCKLVGVVKAWLRYVHSYESLLSVLGYPAESAFEESSYKMSIDNKFLIHVKNQWKMVSEIERDLSFDVLAQARQVARQRAAVNYQHIETRTEEHADVNNFLISKILSFLMRTFSFMFQSIMHFVFSRGILNQHPEVDGTSRVLSGDSLSHHYCLNFRKMYITVYPLRALPGTIYETSEPHVDTSHLNLLVFCVTLDAFFLLYTVGNTAQSLSVCCGDMKIKSSSFMLQPMERKLREETNHSNRKKSKEMLIDPKVIVWGEPAPKSLVEDKIATNSSNSTQNGCVLHLESCLEELWWNWQKIQEKFDVRNAQYIGNPFFLCEIQNSLIDKCLDQPGIGIWKCNVSFGKLNVDLGHSSIVSIALLQRQIQHTLHWVGSHEGTSLHSQSPTIEESEEIKWENYQKSYVPGTKMAMLTMIPEKKIQIGIVMVGPKIRMSLQDSLYCAEEQVVNNNVTQGIVDFYITFNLENINLSVWTTLKDSSAASTEGSNEEDGELQQFSSNEPRLLNTVGEGLKEIFINQGCIRFDSWVMINGITVYLEDLEENQQHQLFGLKSVVIQSVSCREYTHSFATTVIALSTSMRGIGTGAICLSFMDEFQIFLKVIECLLSALSYTSTNFEFVSGVYPQEGLSETEGSLGKDPDEVIQTFEKGILLILKCTKYVIDASFEFGSIDIIMHNSRKNHIMEYYKKAHEASNNSMLSGPDVLEYGIAFSVQKSQSQILWKEESVKTCIDLLGLQFVIFRYESQIGADCDVYELISLLHQSPNCLYELSLSDFSLTLCASSRDEINIYASGSTTSVPTDGPPSSLLIEGSDIQSFDINQRLRSKGPNLPLPLSDHQFLINITLGEILMAEYSLKKVLIRAHQPIKLLSSLCIGMEHHTITWTIQGGLIILETTALAMFIRCSNEYILWIQNASSVSPSREYISSRKQPEAVKPYKKTTRWNSHLSKESPLDSTSSLSHLETCNVHSQSKLQLLEDLRLSLIQFSIVLVAADGSGGAWEFLLEADFQLNFELINLRRKLLFDLSRLTILSQHLHESCPDQMAEIEVLHFSPYADDSLLSATVSGVISPELPPVKIEPPVHYDACFSKAPVVHQEYMAEKDVAGHSHSIHGNCILKHAAASIQLEKKGSRQNVGSLCSHIDWIGSCSASGLDLTISLSEIQMVLSLIEPLSGHMSGDAVVDTKQRYRPRNQEPDNVLEDTIPDGAVVALQDIHQHTYFAVEGIENKYHVVGTIHHSLVGERALFRIKYCKKNRWGSTASWFTLTSLHAGSGSGEPLRLNYRSGSGFVDISSNTDNNYALWSMLPYKPEIYEVDNDYESNSQVSKSTFYLVNKKCDCSVAFTDGVPEFVKKPGNPFKVKLFPDVSLTHHVLRRDTQSGESGDPDVQYQIDDDEDQTHEDASNLPYINISILSVALTIVHELPDSKDKFPLLQASIDNIQFIVQVLPSKFRIMGAFTSAILYFDAQGNIWRELVRPVEMSTFYRSKFEFQNSEVVSKGLPVYFYFRIKQVDVSITELSLDIILFVAGELRMAGPFAVRSSVIFANCCKVENQSSLSLVCHFYDNMDATVAGKKSTSIFIRPVALADRSENSSILSVQLAAHGDFITSPIHVSLLKARVFAWRTCVVHGSINSPGPYVVIDVSKRTEDGLSVVVSPLLRIHNETGLPVELRFWRPQQVAESASVLLGHGDTIDDSMAALDAINLSGGSKKVLMSLVLGNFLFSCRPEITESLRNHGEQIYADWSEDLKGGKAVRLSGVFDKLGYRFKRALGVESKKISFRTVHCALNVEGAHATDLHFLVQTIGQDVPVVLPDNFRDTSETRSVPVALQEHKEIFLLPTVQISNYLQTEIHVLLTETNPESTITEGCNYIGKRATVSCGSSVYLYANPAMIYFTVTLTAFDSSCKAVNSGDWANKLQKKKKDIDFLDIDLNFCGGKYFASLRLSRSDRGILKAAIFTSYILKNDSDLSFLCFASDQKSLSRLEVDKFGSSLPPDLGTFLPAKSIRSWFMKSNRMNIKLLEENVSTALLDLDVVSGFTEVCLETHVGPGVRYISKLGISLRPWHTKMSVPSQIVAITSRYVISNETEQSVFVRQHYLEEDTDGIITVESKQKVALHMEAGGSSTKEISLFDSLFRKHRHANEDYLIYIQFRLFDTGWSWSGPVCVSSLGRFFLKFRRQNQSSPVFEPESKSTEFAVVHVVEEGSSLVLHFDRPSNFSPPYRIENLLPNAFITYCQKDSVDSEILRSGGSVGYVWDDMSLPHQLVVQITDTNLSREINMDKVRSWKPFYKVRQQRGLALELPLDKKLTDRRKAKDESHGLEMLKVGYEVYADGLTRVLRISEYPGRGKEDAVFHLCAKIQFRVSNLAVQLLENKKQDENVDEPSGYSPIVVARLGNITLDSIFTDQNKYNRIRIQSINVDEKWSGAPFAAMLRRNESDYSNTNENFLQVIIILLSTDSGVKKVKYFSTVLQPVQLNLDEETLIRFVPFWRASLNDSNTQSQQFYFQHFEIHPVKIVASFLPGSSDSSYTSAQETLRSFLHSIIKIPSVKNKNVELNGILLTNALVTVRELFFKCAQHYSWYGMRAVYIAKGSPLLPPAFASIFDDSASSSLDIFFDPSSGIVNLPGITIGTFKFISKCINKKGFSGTKRYFGDLGKTVKTAGSNVLFAAVTELSDSILKGAEANGFKGMVNGFHQGILKLALEPSVLGTAVMEGGPDRKIKLDRSPGVDELYIEGYLQAMLDTIYRQEYLRVRVIDDQVVLKNLPPSSSLVNEIMDRVKSFLMSKALLQGEPSTNSHHLRHLRGEREWKIGPTILTLWEHLFVSFAIRMLRKQAFKLMANIKEKRMSGVDSGKTLVIMPTEEKRGIKVNIKWGVRKFVFSGVVAYLDGRLCRSIPNAVVRRIVSGFLLSLLDENDNK